MPRPLRPALAAGVRAVFRLPARLRRAPALHPERLLCADRFEVVPADGRPGGVPWLDGPGTYRATVRLFRAAGLPRRLPDGLGPAVRVEDAAGPGRPVDLLLTSSGAGRLSRHIPRMRANALGGPCPALLSYRTGGRRRVPAAFPRSRRPVRAGPPHLRRALAAGPLVFGLRAAGPGERWRTFAVLAVREPVADGPATGPAYALHRHCAPGFTPTGTLSGLRDAACRGSRAGR
ncbi:phosphodiesterase [Streptomyces echinoruber]|uniref:Phosphodiesterase n=1 Tax=Streptomyces echinoruber TaxID=68898 RepID=A0A918RIZ2_9ACTN|nr:phosphodiesterase [Streptomyces echinoruber]GHA00810.1 hypothetical protein GCM10010389_45070 [Streptomyces echinoruber]